MAIELDIESAKGTARGKAELKVVGREQAVKKAAFVWVGSWLAAAAAIPIPIVHFIAPPLLLIGGPILGFFVFKLYDGATDVTGGRCACPSCGKAWDLAPAAASWPLQFACPECQAQLTIRPTAAPS